MSEAVKYAVGDEVRVFDVNSRRMGQPKGGWPATVVKVGRTLVHVQRTGWRDVEQYRMDTGHINDKYGHQWIKTPDEVERDELVSEAVDVLRGVGIEKRLGGRTPDDLVLRLAATVNEWRRGQSEVAP